MENGNSPAVMYMQQFHPGIVAKLQSEGKNINYENVVNEGLAYLFGYFVFRGTDSKNLSQQYQPEVILSSDVEIFADLGLMPDWMRPSQLGYASETIGEDYFRLVKEGVSLGHEVVAQEGR
jgi:hypothetical protein